MRSIKFGNKTMRLPASRLARMGIGIVLIVAGLLGFLPIFGFWMVPLGLIILRRSGGAPLAPAGIGVDRPQAQVALSLARRQARLRQLRPQRVGPPVPHPQFPRPHPLTPYPFSASRSFSA